MIDLKMANDRSMCVDNLLIVMFNKLGFSMYISLVLNVLYELLKSNVFHCYSCLGPITRFSGSNLSLYIN